MSDSSKGDDNTFRLEKGVPVKFNSSLIDEGYSFLGTQQRVSKSVVPIRGYIDDLGQDQLGLCPYLSDLIFYSVELLLNFQVCDHWFPDSLSQ